jgi:hypothetical protein
MLGHETVSVADPVVLFVDVLEGVQEDLAVCIALEYRPFLVSTRSDMINCAGIFYAERAGHAATTAEEIGNVNPQDLTPKRFHIERFANLLPPTPRISYVEQIGIHTWVLSGGVHV